MLTSVKRSGNRIILRINENISDMQAGETFKDALTALYTQGEREIVLDFGSVNVISSHGIGKILMFYKRLKEAGGQMYVAPLNPHIREIFEALMLDKLIPEVRNEK